MDRLKRVTGIEEFRLGQRYYWLKGRTYRGPLECREIQFKEDCVKFAAPGSDFVVGSFNWRSRYIHAADVATSCRVFFDLPGRVLRSILDLRVKLHLERKRVRGFNQCCGNCEFWCPSLEVCRNGKNELEWGAPMPAASTAWCQWFQRAIRG